MRDAFNATLQVGAMVHYAGTDYKKNPTINMGLVDKLNEETAQVRVLRVRSRGLTTDTDERRRVWVKAVKVAHIFPPDPIALP